MIHIDVLGCHDLLNVPGYNAAAFIIVSTFSFNVFSFVRFKCKQFVLQTVLAYFLAVQYTNN